MTYPAAQAIQESFPKMSELEAEFLEVLLWYDGFKDVERMKVLPYRGDDMGAIVRKMQDARSERDFKMSDHLREVLRGAGCAVKNQNPD